MNSTNDCRHTPSDTGLISTFHAFGDNQEVNAETASKGGSSTQSRYWTADEHKRFLEGLARFGHKDMKAIARFVGTRNATQVRTHAQKYYLKLAREAAKRQANQYKRFASEDSVPYLVEQRRSEYNLFSFSKKPTKLLDNTPVCVNASDFLLGSRNDSDFLFPVDNSDSSEMECRVVTSKHLTSNNFQDEKEANSNSRFEVANLHMMDFGQDSSFGEVSVTSEGLSECKSVCNDHFSPISFYDVEGADAFNKEETCIYGLLHRDKNEQATNVSSQSSVDT